MQNMNTENTTSESIKKSQQDEVWWWKDYKILYCIGVDHDHIWFFVLNVYTIALKLKNLDKSWIYVDDLHFMCENCA